MRECNFNYIFDLQGKRKVSYQLFPKFLSGHLGCHHEFLSITQKLIYLRVSANPTDDFSQKLFSANFTTHLEFLRKMHKRIYLRNDVRQSDFEKILDPRVSVFSQICFPPLLASILYVHTKCKDTFVSEMVQDRVTIRV